MFIPTLIQEATARFSTIQTKFVAAQTKGALATDPGASELDWRRRTRLNRTAASQTARSLVLAADASPRAITTQRGVIESLSQERLIGSNDLLDINFLELAIAVARGVGRVRVSGGFGTGFLIGPGLMMTNHHVIAAAPEAAQASLQLDYQDNAAGEVLTVQSFRLDSGACFVSDRDLDFSIVGVRPISDKNCGLDTYPWVQLIPDPGKTDVGDPINIIQHPRGGLKQIAFRENKILALTSSEPRFLFYSTDTEPGSSGSPCFNDQWELVALHHSGVAKTDDQKRLLKKDGTIWKEGDDPALLEWVANEGIRISRIVAFLRSVSLKPEMQDAISRALTMRPPNPVEKARAAGAGASRPGSTGLISDRDRSASPAQVMPLSTATSSNGSLNFNVPLRLTVSLGGAQDAQVPDAAAATVAHLPPFAPVMVERPAEELAVVIDQDYTDRDGYDPEFLGVNISLPKISDKMAAVTSQVSADAVKHGDPHELTYYHYSVYMNKRRRTAWFSAGNVDGDNRPGIGKRPADRWYVDTRIPSSDQLSQVVFEPGIDRGHLTRREDTDWGADFESALKANNDTFHFTNCSLQASLFNRGKDRWQGLEQFLLEQHAKKDKRRLVVITGPVFADNDPVYQNTRMDFAVRCPLQFWKVCVLVRQDGTLSSTGFILGQEDIKGLPGFEEEVFAVALAQTTLMELESKTGLSFGDLKNHDHLAEGGAPGTLELDFENGAKRILKPIMSETDIVV
jgi:endonuclease G